MSYSCPIKSITKPPKHYFFGFHDLLISNRRSDRLLVLQVDEIHHPPYSGQGANIGFIERESGNFHKVGQTVAWNFPQGSRQQWVGDTNQFVVNNRIGERWAAQIYDSDSEKMIEELPESVHTMCAKSGLAFSMNYSRIQRLGGYGYIGLSDTHSEEAAPSKDGIYRQNIYTKVCSLLISLQEIAACQNDSSLDPSRHHYVTHLSLNPSGTRLAFLHRYRLPDGGEMTRLMTIGVNGESPRCLLSGFLSHFDWKDDETIFIWGRANQIASKLRSNLLLRNKLVASIIKYLKSPLRKMLRNTKLLNLSFLLVSDFETPTVSKIAEELITEDGHPMFYPSNRDWMVNDTYPDHDGFRTLMLYQFSKNNRIDLGRFKMINELPEMNLINEIVQDIDPRVLKDFPLSQYAFTRSGLHCDLHPRWLADGSAVAFDSIHEGSRQVYLAEIVK